MMMMQDIQGKELPPGWLPSRRGGWHNPDCAGAGLTGVVKQGRAGRYGWAVYGRGDSPVAGWFNARSPAQAAQAAERAAVNAAAERLAGAAGRQDDAAAAAERAAAELQAMLAPAPAPAPAGVSALSWCSVCGRDLARLRYCYGRIEDGGLIALCPRCYR